MVSAAQLRKSPLDRLSSLFGGNVNPMNRQGEFYAWQWNRYGHQARFLLESILPYLVLKQDEAQDLIDYLDTGAWQGKPVPQQVIDERYAIIANHEYHRKAEVNR
jgi:hypothetical protein